MAVVLITGCSSGIGKCSALEMARRGHRVFASMRSLESARFLRADADCLRNEFLRRSAHHPCSIARHACATITHDHHDEFDIWAAHGATS